MTTTRTRRVALRGTIAAGILAAAISALHVPVAAAATPTTCGGVQATLLGSDLADSMGGTTAADVLSAGGGEDRLRGLGGDDRLCGGDGYDELTGGPGADLLDGGAGPDAALFGDAIAPVSADLASGAVTGGAGADRLVSIESLYGSEYPDTLSGGSLNEYIGGAGGNDRISGGSGADRLDGGAGDDTILAKDGFVDRISCGEGRDTYEVDADDVVAADCEVDLGGDDVAANPVEPDPHVDVTRPSVRVTSPASGSRVSGTIALTAAASDDTGVRAVYLYVDGVVRSTDTVAPFSVSVDTRSLSEGQHRFSAIARDTSGNLSITANLYATVANRVVSSTADTDGDGLLDTWETRGIDVNGDGVIDLDLAAMGADPRHKDLFVEIDTMRNVPRLRAGSLKMVTESFRVAPVSNPDGVKGITLHVDNGASSVMNPRTGAAWGSRSRQDIIPFSSYTNTGYGFSGVDVLRSRYFTDAARRKVFRYALNVNRHTSADMDSGGIATLGGVSFLVSLGYTAQTNRDVVQATMFMHELGHNLGLQHGGHDDINDKPNYLSIMNYTWGWDGLRPVAGGHAVDYSRFDSSLMPTLYEGSLNEGAGIRGSVGASRYYGAHHCGTTRRLVRLNTRMDWNCNGAIGGFVARVVRHTGHFSARSPRSLQTLQSSNDWARIRLGLSTSRAKKHVRVIAEPVHRTSKRPRRQVVR